jgi:hypothetical protein
MSEADTNEPQPASQKEPPVEGPEVHHPHKHHGGGGLPRWLELGIALTALVTSISSIFIAVHHGQIMEKLVQANSLPYVQGGVSNVTTEGTQVLSLDLLNRGVGPAHEQSLRVKADGKYVTTVDELLAISLPPDQLAEIDKARNDRVMTIASSNVKHRFIPGGDSQLIFRIVRTPENARYWDMVNKVWSRWDIEYCYCSVFAECWKVNGLFAEPEPVKECVRDEPHEFMPQRNAGQS